MISGSTNVYYVTEEVSLANPGQTTGFGWYFTDEIESLYGPYATEQLAKDAYRDYCREELGND